MIADLPYLAATLMLAATLSGCAAPTAPRTAVATEAVGSGVIVACRPLPPHGAAVPALVGFVGVRPASVDEMEFVVLSDGGATISVVQANTERFVPGDHVRLLRGARTRIERPTP